MFDCFCVGVNVTTSSTCRRGFATRVGKVVSKLLIVFEDKLLEPGVAAPSCSVIVSARYAINLTWAAGRYGYDE